LKAYLLDTNALLWLGLDDTMLRPATRQLLLEAALFASVISAAEISIKHSIGKLELPPPFRTDFTGSFQTLLNRLAVDLLPLELGSINHMAQLPLHHRDPFDRIIIAQALERGFAVATRDRAFLAYDGLDVLEV